MASQTSRKQHNAQRPRALLGFIAVLIAAVLLWASLPSKTVPEQLAQGALLAACAIAGTAWACPSALLANSAKARKAFPSDGTSPKPQSRAKTVGLAAGIIALGFAGGLAAALSATNVPQAVFAIAPAARVAQTLALFALSCLLTGLFEEGLFRVLALEAFFSSFSETSRTNRQAALLAALASSALFGIVHIGTADIAHASTALHWIQIVLKPVQAALFGFALAAVYAKTRSLWTPSLVHGAFNLLYFGPTLIVSGALPTTHVTGSPADAIILATTTIALVPAGIAAWRMIGDRGPQAKSAAKRL